MRDYTTEELVKLVQKYKRRNAQLESALATTRNSIEELLPSFKEALRHVNNVAPGNDLPFHRTLRIFEELLESTKPGQRFLDELKAARKAVKRIKRFVMEATAI